LAAGSNFDYNLNFEAISFPNRRQLDSPERHPDNPFPGQSSNANKKTPPSSSGQDSRFLTANRVRLPWGIQNPGFSGLFLITVATASAHAVPGMKNGKANPGGVVSMFRAAVLLQAFRDFR